MQRLESPPINSTTYIMLRQMYQPPQLHDLPLLITTDQSTIDFDSRLDDNNSVSDDTSSESEPEYPLKIFKCLDETIEYEPGRIRCLLTLFVDEFMNKHNIPAKTDFPREYNAGSKEFIRYYYQFTSQKAAVKLDIHYITLVKLFKIKSWPRRQLYNYVDNCRKCPTVQNYNVLIKFMLTN